MQMEQIHQEYNRCCHTNTDINELLPILYNYATKSESIVELGVRECNSTWAFVWGLLNNGSNKKKFLMNDIAPCDVQAVMDKTRGLPIQVDYAWMNDLELQLCENVDLTFIDTWHVYAQLKRELAKYAPFTNKYIIMHDTTVDAIDGETVRQKNNSYEQSLISGYPIHEIECGLKKAIDEFLINQPEWKIREIHTYCNGLTVLERIPPLA